MMRNVVQRGWRLGLLVALVMMSFSMPAVAYEPQTHSLLTHLSWEYLSHRARAVKDERARLALDDLGQRMAELRVTANAEQKVQLGFRPDTDLFIATSPYTTAGLLWGQGAQGLPVAGAESLLGVATANMELEPQLWFEAQTPWQPIFEADRPLSSSRGALVHLAHHLELFKRVLSERFDETLCQSAVDFGAACQLFNRLSSGQLILLQTLEPPLSAFWISGALIAHGARWLSKYTRNGETELRRLADDFWGCYTDPYYKQRGITELECQNIASKLSSVSRWLIPSQPVDERALAKARLVSMALACRAKDSLDPDFDALSECDPEPFLSMKTPWWLSSSDERALVKSSSALFHRLPLWLEGAPWMESQAEVSALSSWFSQRPELVAAKMSARAADWYVTRPPMSLSMWMSSAQAGWSEDAVATLIKRRVCEGDLDPSQVTEDGLGQRSCDQDSFKHFGLLASQRQLPYADESILDGWSQWLFAESAGVELSAPPRVVFGAEGGFLLARQSSCDAEASLVWSGSCASPLDCVVGASCQPAERNDSAAIELASRIRGLGQALHGLQELGVPSRWTADGDELDDAYEGWVAAYLDPASAQPLAIFDGEDLAQGQRARWCVCDDDLAACQASTCMGQSGWRPAAALTQVSSPWFDGVDPSSSTQAGYLRLRQRLKVTAQTGCADDTASLSPECLWSEVDAAYLRLQSLMEALSQSQGGCDERFSVRQLAVSLGFALLQLTLDESEVDGLTLGLSPAKKRLESFWRASFMVAERDKSVLWSSVEIQQPELLNARLGTSLWRRVADRSIPYVIAAGAILLREAGALAEDSSRSLCDQAPRGFLGVEKQDGVRADVAAQCSTQKQALLRWCFGLQPLGSFDSEDCRQFDSLDPYLSCNGVEDARTAEDCGLVAAATASCVCALHAGDSSKRLSLTVSQKQRVESCIEDNTRIAQVSIWRADGQVDEETAQHLMGAKSLQDDDGDGIPNLVDQCPDERASKWSLRSQYTTLADGVCLWHDAIKGRCRYGCLLKSVGGE